LYEGDEGGDERGKCEEAEEIKNKTREETVECDTKKEGNKPNTTLLKQCACSRYKVFKPKETVFRLSWFSEESSKNKKFLQRWF
jgi:hypothetical protein